nr:60S ribosomal protein L27a-3 [Ipomoea trifida]
MEASFIGGQAQRHPRRDIIPIALQHQISEVKDKASKDDVPLIDVTQLGFFKVLGKGVFLSNQPVVVKAKLVSKIAEKKIKEASGTVLLTVHEDSPLCLIPLFEGHRLPF